MLDKLTNEHGEIELSPGGKEGDNFIDATVLAGWFVANYPELAEAELPLSENDFQNLCGIDNYWKTNAERWRSEGRI